MLQYYSKGAGVLNGLLATPTDRSKDRFQADDENGDCVLWLIDGLFDHLIRAQLPS